jgi:hypothetical protein
MCEIEPAHWIDVSARAVNISFTHRKRSEKIWKSKSKVAQARTQIEDVWGGNCDDTAGPEHPMNLANCFAVIFQVFDGFGTGNQGEPILCVGEPLMIEIDNFHRLMGKFHQSIGVIAGRRLHGVARSNQLDQLAGSAPNIEMFAS